MVSSPNPIGTGGHRFRPQREALGPGPRLRLDANGSWTGPEAVRLTQLAVHDIDLVEQPVRDHPIGHLAEVRARLPMPVAANEGLWSEADAYARIGVRQADVFCFSPYWVGSLAAFHRLSHVAHLQGLGVCKHTHGELGIAAAACHQLLPTLPNGVEGRQQTAQIMDGDILTDPLPIATGPRWGVPDGPGLGVTVDEAALGDAARPARARGLDDAVRPGRRSRRLPAPGGRARPGGQGCVLLAPASA